MTAGPVAIWAAYRATRYLVEIGRRRRCMIRIGSRDAGLARQLRSAGARSASFITAFNPQSRACSPHRNALAQRALLRCLRARRLKMLPGAGVGCDGTWPPEPSVLVIGLPAKAGRSLARRFRQNAFVQISIGRPARLEGVLMRARLSRCQTRYTAVL